MLCGIVGDVLGSVYEAYQWQRTDLALIGADPAHVHPILKKASWVRKTPDWTDDTLCTLALYSAYVHGNDPTQALLHYCNKYKTQTIGFGGSFLAWLDHPVPYGSFGNGALMRIGFIPFLNISLSAKLRLAHDYTALSHNHPDSFQAVHDFVNLIERLGSQRASARKSKEVLSDYLAHSQGVEKTPCPGTAVERLHQEKKFVINALATLRQAVAVVLESDSMEAVLRNSFYVGGDSDTLACIACNLASPLYACPAPLLGYALDKLKPYPDLWSLVQHYQMHVNQD